MRVQKCAYSCVCVQEGINGVYLARDLVKHASKALQISLEQVRAALRGAGVRVVAME